MTAYAKKVFGLGVTSAAQFVSQVTSSRTFAKYSIAYVSMNAVEWPKKAHLVVVDGLRAFIRLLPKVRATQVVVVSDTPGLLAQIDEFDALDYNKSRSFEFLFKAVDTRVVRNALTREGKVEVKITKIDHLGYTVDRLRRADNMVSKYVAMMSNLDFRERGLINAAFMDMCKAKKFDSHEFVSIVKRLTAGVEYTEGPAKEFLALFDKQGRAYYKAIRSEDDAKQAAAANNVDPYGVSYFRKQARAIGIAKQRMAA